MALRLQVSQHRDISILVVWIAMLVIQPPVGGIRAHLITAPAPLATGTTLAATILATTERVKLLVLTATLTMIQTFRIPGIRSMPPTVQVATRVISVAKGIT
ncbi:MAG: hypothetical protein AMJ53_09510 [Gammaproteobacteria bacterium SG8_11]|nr:MAG: hypothetical protein AMJ53_09510 [Gammaproteobacteria bacterium SG8_11]